MKNWTVERFMQKQLETEVLDDPTYYLARLLDLDATFLSSSDGQFTGGYFSDRYVYESMVYEFDFYMGEIVTATMYPQEFL